MSQSLDRRISPHQKLPHLFLPAISTHQSSQCLNPTALQPPPAMARSLSIFKVRVARTRQYTGTWSNSNQQTASTWLHTHTSPMHKRPSPTQTSLPASRRPSAPPDPSRLQPPLLRYLQSTSLSTSTCCTMPSMPTLARSTSVTSTVLPSCCTRCLEIPRTRADPSSSGATQTQGV